MEPSIIFICLLKLNQEVVGPLFMSFIIITHLAAFYSTPQPKAAHQRFSARLSALRLGSLFWNRYCRTGP